MNFENRVVLITGASRGIGRVIAQRFAEGGARVALNYQSNQAAAEETLQSLAGDGHTLVRADIGNPDQAGELVETTVSRMGRLDILINNAGVYEFHPIDQVSYEAWQQSWQKTIGTNLLGAANVMYHAAQQMIRQGGGRIVNVSSRGAFRGEPQAPAYGASKAGLNAMSQSLAQALAPHNVFVYVVAPGFVETDMAAELLDGPQGEGIRNQSPLRRVARPDEVARTVLFLASEGIDYLTGCIVDINGASYLRS
ncbi:MAG TPA: SDR family oxidoreductase [Blastocatellia bacterium]|nr:SDR family oxidoreductase [Blastocatellia bacterium]